MSNGVSSQVKAQDRLEDDLCEALSQRRSEWLQAADKDRDEARDRFVEALRLFTGFVLEGRLPERERAGASLKWEHRPTDTR